MHFSFLINRCLVLLFTLTVVSSMSHEICDKLRKQEEKIRVLGEMYGGSLFIITTSGHLFKLKLKSTLLKHNSKGHYYLNISQEPTSHVSEKWPNVPLDLSENKNKLYSLLFVQKARPLLAVLSSMIKTKTGDSYRNLHSHECRIVLEIGKPVSDYTVNRFKSCDANAANDNEDAFMVSRTSLYSPNPITFVKSRSSKRYYCDHKNYACFNISNFLTDDTVLAASHLGEPYNILLFIYTSGVVEIRQVPTFPTDEAPSPNWTVRIGDFIQCEATQEPTSTSTQQEEPDPGPESTTTATTDEVPGLWHTHTWRIVAVAVLLVLNGICLVLLYRKRYKKKKKGTRKRKGKCSKVKKKMKSPDRSSIGPIDSSVDNSITGTRRRAESSPTGSPIIRKNKKKVSKCPSSIPKSSTPKGSTIKPSGSTLTSRAESGSPLTNESNSKGSSAQKKKSSKIESTPSSATVSNPSNVNSKASVKLSLAKKKQTTGKWIASLLWAKKKRNEKRNDKKKPKDTKKDNEKK